jgi:hypothetical protein
MKLRPTTLRHWVIGVFGLIGLGLFPWTIWLSASLKAHHETRHWDLAWSGFDSGLALAFLLTAFAAWHKSPWVGALAAATGTLLITDAWFDIVLETGHARTRAIITALIAELPMAAVCVAIALRVEGVVERALALHLAASREGAPESDLVGVLEISSDGQPAREPGHPHASP